MLDTASLRPPVRLLLLKALQKKEILVPAYVRRDGTVVAAHHKVVNYNPDMHAVLAGNAPASFKVALKKLSKISGFKQLPLEVQYAHIMSSAQNIQSATTKAGQISVFKKELLAGKKPPPGSIDAFKELLDKDPAKAIEVIGGPDKLLELVIAARKVAKNEPSPAAPFGPANEGKVFTSAGGVEFTYQDGVWLTRDGPAIGWTQITNPAYAAALDKGVTLNGVKLAEKPGSKPQLISFLQKHGGQPVGTGPGSATFKYFNNKWHFWSSDGEWKWIDNKIWQEYLTHGMHPVTKLPLKVVPEPGEEAAPEGFGPANEGKLFKTGHYLVTFANGQWLLRDIEWGTKWKPIINSEFVHDLDKGQMADGSGKPLAEAVTAADFTLADKNSKLLHMNDIHELSALAAKGDPSGLIAKAEYWNDYVGKSSPAHDAKPSQAGWQAIKIKANYANALIQAKGFAPIPYQGSNYEAANIARHEAALGKAQTAINAAAADPDNAKVVAIMQRAHDEIAGATTQAALATAVMNLHGFVPAEENLLQAYKYLDEAATQMGGVLPKLLLSITGKPFGPGNAPLPQDFYDQQDDKAVHYPPAADTGHNSDVEKLTALHTAGNQLGLKHSFDYYNDQATTGNYMSTGIDPATYDGQSKADGKLSKAGVLNQAIKAAYAKALLEDLAAKHPLSAGEQQVKTYEAVSKVPVPKLSGASLLDAEKFVADIKFAATSPDGPTAANAAIQSVYNKMSWHNIIGGSEDEKAIKDYGEKVKAAVAQSYEGSNYQAANEARHKAALAAALTATGVNVTTWLAQIKKLEAAGVGSAEWNKTKKVWSNPSANFGTNGQKAAKIGMEWMEAKEAAAATYTADATKPVTSGVTWKAPTKAEWTSMFEESNKAAGAEWPSSGELSGVNPAAWADYASEKLALMPGTPQWKQQLAELDSSFIAPGNLPGVQAAARILKDKMLAKEAALGSQDFYDAGVIDSLNASAPAAVKKPGPHEGDVKPSKTGGWLILKKGHWVKAGPAEVAGLQTPYHGKAPPPSVPFGAELIDSWKKVSGQTGYNPGATYRDENGDDWYCKFPTGGEKVVRNELLANKLYGAAGVGVPEAKLVVRDGKVGVASRIIKGAALDKAALQAGKGEGLLLGFAADAWLANWDVVGNNPAADKGWDNVMFLNGKAIRIDPGGALLYGGAGGAKTTFGSEVSELDTMRDPAINAQTAKVFGKISKADLQASVEKVLAIPDTSVEQLVDEFGPGDAAAKASLTKTLLARKADLAAKFPKVAAKAKKAASEEAAATTAALPKPKKGKKSNLDPHHLPVKPSDLPPPHDFMNWQGSGKPISEKPYVAHNIADEKAIFDFAMKGDLVALKQYKFQPVDKMTGTPVGEPKPIAEHHSKYVKEYYDSVVTYLDIIANPPEPLKAFKGQAMDTIASLARAFKPFNYGYAVHDVPPNQRLGFWIALGTVANPAHFQPVNVFKSITAAAKSLAYHKWKSLPHTVKTFLKAVQGSGDANQPYRDGSETDYQGQNCREVLSDLYANATEHPEGFTIYKWINMPPSMVKQIMSQPVGLVFQNPGSMCCSTSGEATKGFGEHRIIMHYAKGAKGMDTFGSGSLEHEQEVTSIPGMRCMVLSRKMIPGPISGKRLELETLMLPPDPTYVANIPKKETGPPAS